MAASDNSPPPLAAEPNPSAVDPTAEPNLSAVDQQPNQIQNTTRTTQNTPPPSEQLPSVPSPPPFIDSIDELKSLSDAISSFRHCYDDLHSHIDSIKAAICSKLPSQTLEIIPLPPSSSSPRVNVSNVKIEEQNLPKSELESLCKTMCSREVRKYMVAHLSDLSKLREEVPNALKLAPSPAKLVLDCSGKFFLQGSKAFARDSPMIPAREASILILECFLLMMGMNGEDNGELEIDKSVRREAEKAALAWRSRLVAEGGVAKANQIDARGLLLFIACFGIPNVFKREDIRDLVVAANAKEIVGALQNSQVLMKKISEIVEGMTKKNMEVDAVDIVYTFGLQERFDPQSILTSFLQESKESRKYPRKASQSSAATQNEAKKRQLGALKSVRKCLEKHNIDPAKLLPEWKIGETILTLEKDIADSDRKSGEKTAQKRKESETETSKKAKTQPSKRSRYTDHGSQQQKASGHIDNRRSLLDRHSTHSMDYSAPPAVVYGGPGAGLLPESMIPPGVGAGLSVNRGGAISTGSYGVHGGVLVNTAGQVINCGTHPYLLHGDAELIEKYAGQSSLGLTSLYRASASREGFPGVPNASSVGLGSRSSASSLYQFADSVLESESYPNNVLPRSGGAISTAVAPAHHLSYLYRG